MKSLILNVALYSISCLFITNVSAQVAAIHLTVKVPALNTGEKNVYLVGSFNNWATSDSLYKMKKVEDGIYTITIPVFDGKQYEYKYTKGGWDRSEVTLDDSETHNRIFFSTNEKSIIDTVVKWRQPKQAGNNDNPQVQRLNAMKDSALANIKPGLNDMVGILKSYVQNLLQEEPNERVQKRLDKKAEKKLNHTYEQITKLLWNIMAALTPEQKKEIQDHLNNPAAKDDFLNTFINAFTSVMKGKTPMH